MLTIRLQRRGRTNDPSFRVIVVDSKKPPKTGAYLEMVGSLDRRTKHVELNAERIRHWLANGATVSPVVHNLLVSEKVIEGKKINVLPRKSPLVPEAAQDKIVSESAALDPAAEDSAAKSPAPQSTAQAVDGGVAAGSAPDTIEKSA